jgi:hypothetical protein
MAGRRQFAFGDMRSTSEVEVLRELSHLWINACVPMEVTTPEIADLTGLPPLHANRALHRLARANAVPLMRVRRFAFRSPNRDAVSTAVAEYASRSTRPTDLTVLRGFVALSEPHSLSEFSATAEQVAASTGLSVFTVRSALPRLARTEADPLTSVTVFVLTGPFHDAS